MATWHLEARLRTSLISIFSSGLRPNVSPSIRASLSLGLSPGLSRSLSPSLSPTFSPSLRNISLRLISNLRPKL